MTSTASNFCCEAALLHLLKAEQAATPSQQAAVCPLASAVSTSPTWEECPAAAVAHEHFTLAQMAVAPVVSVSRTLNRYSTNLFAQVVAASVEMTMTTLETFSLRLVAPVLVQVVAGRA